jgi:hypothetical protein
MRLYFAVVQVDFAALFVTVFLTRKNQTTNILASGSWYITLFN